MSKPVRKRKVVKRAFLLFLALIFLFESWLWKETGRFIGWIIKKIPLDHAKRFITHHVKELSPIATLGVFIIPALILLPLKVTAVWLLAKGYFVAGLSTVVLAKALGLGISSFLFSLCKTRLLELRWVRYIYEKCVHLYDNARHIVTPYMNAIKQQFSTIYKLLPNSPVRRRLSRMRRHAKRNAARNQSV